MPLSAGEKLGPYEIISLIGKGGMGEVYSAHDSRTGRDVAIKISAERFNERFDREVRAVAALNHPNICTLFDVGPNYLVMELVEGESPHGPMPLDTAMNYARQIAAALEEAHEKGIVHRDLKPGNIKIKPDGTVKVLDFGLAKMGGTPATRSEDSPTISMAATQAGMILGTAAYMSPEQAKGKPVDRRADIWAFGVVFHEMLTGERLFQHDDLTETLAAVVMKAPELDRAPLEVRRLLKRCLEKDPKKRLRDIGDVWELLEVPQAAAAAPVTGNPSGRWFAWAVAGALAVALAVALWTLWPQPAEHPLTRLEVSLGPDAIHIARTSVAISHDGRRIVYLTRSGLATRTLDQTAPVVLSGTAGAEDPFFSPNADWVGFTADGKLKKISVLGGSAVTLCDAPAFRGAAWTMDGGIVAALSASSGLVRVSEGGGAPEEFTKLANGETTHRWPQMLPGGDAVVFTSTGSVGNYDEATIEIVSLKSRQVKTVARGGYFGRYLPTGPSVGHLVYLRRGVLVGAPFDPKTLQLQGSFVPLLDGVASNGTIGSGQFDASRTGTVVYVSGKEGGMRLDLMDSAGKTTPLLAKPGDYLNAILSPDGKTIALAESGDIHEYDIVRETHTRRTVTGSGNELPVWTPDGKHLVYDSSKSRTIFWMRADGAGEPQVLLVSQSARAMAFSFTPDGKRLAYIEQTPTNQGDVWTVPLDLSDAEHPQPGKPEPFLQTPADELAPAFSPDGRWLAYQSNESGGRVEINVRPFPGPGGQIQVSSDGGRWPAWSRDGKRLFYVNADLRVMVSDVTTKGEVFDAAKPRIWSDHPIFDPGFYRIFSLAPDGQHILTYSSSEEQQGSLHMMLIENFFDEVRRRSPVSK